METFRSDHKKLTISDVADALHVSKTTVSRAFSGKGRISEDTRQRVLAYIEANDYNNFTKRAYVGKAKKFLSLPAAYARAALSP